MKRRLGVTIDDVRQIASSLPRSYEVVVHHRRPGVRDRPVVRADGRSSGELISCGPPAVVPKGVSTDKQAAILQLLQFMLTPDQQAKAYDKGYFYPGPAIKGVDLSKAPQSRQTAITEFGRPEYDKLIADNPTEVPLDAKGLVAAFDKWDREVGGSKVKKS